MKAECLADDLESTILDTVMELNPDILNSEM